MKKTCQAGVAENTLIDLHSLNFESVAQHFQQHFYMTLKSGIHYIVYVCSFLGSYKSVAQHFQSVAQHILRKDTRKMKPLCVMAKCNNHPVFLGSGLQAWGFCLAMRYESIESIIFFVLFIKINIINERFG